MNHAKNDLAISHAPRVWHDLVEWLASAFPKTTKSQRFRAARRAIETVALLKWAIVECLLSDGEAESVLGEAVDRLGESFCWADLPEAMVEPVRFGVGWAWERLAFSTETKQVDPADFLGRLHQRLLDTETGETAARATRRRRKSSGTFYTPAPVARFMADGALAEWASDRPPRVLDPACGCGIFLTSAIRAFQKRPRAAEKSFDMRALAGAITGIDLDPDAVFLARGAVLLTLARFDSNGIERPLLDVLMKNIRTGDAMTDNSLVSNEEPLDLVLGNPPYLRERGAKALFDRIGKTEFGRRWHASRMDLWHYFVHRGLDLLREGGVLSFIVNGYWTAGRGAKKLIDRLQSETRFAEMVDLEKYPVFDQVNGHHLIFRLVKRSGSAERGRPTTIRRISSQAFSERGSEDTESLFDGRVPFVTTTKTHAELFHDGRIDLEPSAGPWLDRLSRFPSLGQFGQVRQGIAENPASINRRTNERYGQRWTVGEGVFVLTDDEVDRLDLDGPERALVRPYYRPSDFDRFSRPEKPSAWLIYSTAETWPELERFPTLRDHLVRFRPIMEARRETRLGARAWWHLHWPREVSLWEGPKVVVPQMAPRPTAVATEGSVYLPFSANLFVPDPSTQEHPNYWVALLGSRLLHEWFRHHAKRRGIGLEIGCRTLSAVPVRPIRFDDSGERRKHDRLVELVELRFGLAGDSDAARQVEEEIDTTVETLFG